MSTVATRYTRFQVGAAAAALTAATVLTPAVIAPTLANAKPSSSSSVSSPVIYPSSFGAKSAAAPACAAEDVSVGCFAVQAAAPGGTNPIVRGAVVFVGTVAYVIAQGTGQVFQALGSILPGPFGAFFTAVGNGVSAFANQIAITLQVGPYQTAQ